MNTTTFRGFVARKWMIVAFAVLILLLAVIYLAIPTADLRNDAIKRSGITEQAAVKGRQLLLTAAQAHGIEKATSYTTADFTFADDWTGLMGKLMNPWPENKKLTRMQTLLGAFTSRVEFLEGRGAGEIWGIQAWASYKQENINTEAVFEEDGTIRFFLPTQQYFSELVDWWAERAKNIETAFIGAGFHYVQEDQPYAIGRAISDWYRRLK